MVTETGSTNLFIEMVMFRKGNINITFKSDIQDHYYAVSYFHTFKWKKCLFLKKSQKKYEHSMHWLRVTAWFLSTCSVEFMGKLLYDNKINYVQ